MRAMSQGNSASATTQPWSVATTQPWSVRMADSVMKRGAPMSARWHYENGVMLKAIEQVWQKTGDDKYWAYIKEISDQFIDPAGNVRTYTVVEYNLDQVNPGKILFPLYKNTGDERYKHAIYLLREQLRWQPRTNERGFWHKRIYPYQMWLDGIYMASPFYAEFANTFDDPAAFDDVAHQITLIEKHTRDPKTGLLYHGWDESKQQRWADPETGLSPHFWGRAIGWYAMAIVDVLDYFPVDHPKRGAIISVFERMVAALSNVQDQPTGLWYQVLDQGNRPGNYLEASASCMFVHAIAKGIRKGYLDKRVLAMAQRGYEGILENLIEVDALGLVNLHWTCGGAGLGGTPYRDGSFEYYVGEKIVTNDYKGVGPFIMASVEMENV
jgi:unsaturated rhamnogalacturonyl hydrolase